MPIDVSTGKTFGELMLDLAVRIQQADQSGAGDELPTDTGVLAMLKRWVNEGYDLFQRSDPNWSALDFAIDFTLSSTAGPNNWAGDTGRYMLPRYCQGGPVGDWVYTDENSAYARVIRRPADVLDRLMAQDNVTGTPAYWACRSQRRDDGPGEQTDGTEVMFWPRPDRAYTLRASFRVRGHKLFNAEDRHIFGADHDRAIVDAAHYQWAQHDRENAAALVGIKQTWLESKDASITLDMPRRPRRLGVLKPTTPARDMRASHHTERPSVDFEGTQLQ